jgi:hypothetical protein
MKRIYLAIDKACWTQDKIDLDVLGGTQAFFLLLKRWIRSTFDDVEVDHPLTRRICTYNLAIHENSVDTTVNAVHHILWGGSWQARHWINAEIVSKVILVSEYMKKIIGFKEAIVLPAPIRDDVFFYRAKRPVCFGGLNDLACHSNYNRFSSHLLSFVEEMVEWGWSGYFHVFGGNSLYGPRFSNGPLPQHSRIIVHGVLRRPEVFEIMRNCVAWAYPNFSDESETLCVAAIEAAALGMMTFLPNKQPFREILREQATSGTVGDMVREIRQALYQGVGTPLVPQQYTEQVVMPKYMTEIRPYID